MVEIITQGVPSITNARKVARSIVPRKVRNWLRSPSTSARWLCDEVKYFCGSTKVVEMRPGWLVACHPAAYRCAYFAQKTDLEQVAELDGFINNSSEGMTLLDIGAHFGLFSFAALHYGGPTARAIAVDPSPIAARFLHLQAKLNDTARRLQVIQASVSDRAGWQSMVAVGVLASGYYVFPNEGYPASELSRTKALTLDDIVDEFAVTPTHIKIDVEGNEAAVLRGGQKVFSQIPSPIVFLEAHNEIVRGLGGNPEETLRLLRQYGYETFTSADIPISDRAILAEPLIRIIARKPLP
jgi:FkbM family methyltransferase